ncbi:cytochrome P450 [Diplogelasinospora grovesii]|uniref:Cytochrome P450 n=1 Tax=Diplogelasinospora grovesii TaxID=303347 RepID=A0AAN6RZ37_9PEZI|nr:cytochrome P450 [Diplogelasinospora grovesii]
MGMTDLTDLMSIRLVFLLVSCSNTAAHLHVIAGAVGSLQMDQFLIGPIVRVGPNTLSISSLKAARTIYGNKPLLLKNEMYDAFSPGPKGVPCGLFPERDPEIHAEMRLVFAPCFFEEELRRQEAAVQKQVELLVDQIEHHGLDENGVDINFWARSYASDVISHLSFGQPFGSLETGTMHFWVAPLRRKFVLSAIFECCRRFPLMGSVYRHLYVRFGKVDAQALHSYSSAQIKRRLASPPRADYIGAVYKPGEKGMKLDLQSLRANLYGMIIGATETTSFAITAALYYLAKNQSAQQRLSEEVRSRFASYRGMTAEETASLPYLRAVIDEAMRMLPPSPLGGMRTSPGMVIDGNYVPAGTEVFASYISLSRSGSYFQMPDTFMPERWADAHNTDTKAASMPFSTGPRNCIGRPLALIKIRLAVAKLIYSFHVTLADEGFDLENKSLHFGGPWVTPPVPLKFHSRGISKQRI